MKFKDKEKLHREVEGLGLAAISKLTSINYMCKTGMEIDAIIKVESEIGEIECGLWSLIPMGLDATDEDFNNQFEHVKKKVDSILEAAKAMRMLKKSFKEAGSK